MPILLIIPFLIFFVIVFFIFVYLRRKQKYQATLLPDYSSAYPKDASYRIVSKDEFRHFSSKKLKLDKIILLHGTFVGDDPFRILSVVENLSTPIANQIRKQLKKQQNIVAKDLGNFTSLHCQKIKEKTNVECENFVWSSGNNHFSRVEGVLKLIDLLTNDEAKEIALIGHSHAGQLFSLLTLLINNKMFKQKMEEILGISIETSMLTKKKFVFLTLGTPPRYNWDLSHKMKLIHVINHRGQDALAGSLTGLLNTRDGDYVQQYGIEGSDMLSVNPKELKMNQKLDTILGQGVNLKKLNENIKMKRRLHTKGKHYLIDYKDNSLTPNCFVTIFGHGVYTKFENLDILLNILEENL